MYMKIVISEEQLNKIVENNGPETLYTPATYLAAQLENQGDVGSSGSGGGSSASTQSQSENPI